MFNTKSKVLMGLAVVGIVVIMLWGILQVKDSDERALVQINANTLSVRVADSTLERVRGLSGYTSKTLKADGMLFIFPEAAVRNFWMKDMKFPLDVVWIVDGKVALISENIPAPQSDQEPVRMSSSPVPVDMVLELPSGDIHRLGIVPGMLIKVQLP